jgi:hypothetical protein
MANRKSTKDKQRSTKQTHKTKDRVTRTPLKIGGELRCSGRVSSSWSTTFPFRVGYIFSFLSFQWENVKLCILAHYHMVPHIIYHIVSRQINRTIIWRSYFPFSISSKSCMHKPSNFLHRKYKVLFFENEINGWCWWGERISFCQLFVCIGTTMCLLNYRVVGLTSASHHTNFKRRIDLMNADKKLYL